MPGVSTYVSRLEQRLRFLGTLARLWCIAGHHFLARRQELSADLIGELQHTQIPWRFGPLHWVLVTPRFHLYHHSIDPAHHDRNFGIVFSFWDRLFGTYRAPRVGERIDCGLDGCDAAERQRSAGLLALPFVSVQGAQAAADRRSS